MLSSQQSDGGTEDWPHSAVFIKTLLQEQSTEFDQFNSYNSIENEGGGEQEEVSCLRPLNPEDNLVIL